MSGTLWGVGIGPGDPELITLKAIRLLGRVPVIAYPAPLSGDSLARSIAAAHLPAGAEEIALRMAFDPASSADPAYDAGARAIAGHLAAGRDVALLCEGDPLLFGSFAYVLGRLAERFPVRVIPGVSSLSACAALAGHPLAARNDALLVVPATRPEAELEALLAAADAAAILKLGRHAGKLLAVLTRLGLVDQAVLVERAGQPGQRVGPANGLAAGDIPYFAMVLVHKRGTAWSP